MILNFDNVILEFHFTKIGCHRHKIPLYIPLQLLFFSLGANNLRILSKVFIDINYQVKQVITFLILGFFLCFHITSEVPVSSTRGVTRSYMVSGGLLSFNSKFTYNTINLLIFKSRKALCGDRNQKKRLKKNFISQRKCSLMSKQ